MPFSLSDMFRPNQANSQTASAAPHPPASRRPSTSASSSASALTDSLTLLVAFLQSPLWLVPLSSFVDANCLHFDTGAEHQLLHTEIHHSYTALCEALLASHMEAVGLSQSAFVAVCQSGLQSDQAGVQRAIGEVLLLDEYPLFHARMVQRNIELDAQVLAECLTAQNQQKNAEKQRDRQRGAQHSVGRRQQAEQAEDDEALRMAIEMSLMEEDSGRKEREREAAEIEYAIQLSLAIQAEELRVAEERQREWEQQLREQQTHQREAQLSDDFQRQAAKMEEHKEVSATPSEDAPHNHTMVRRSSASHLPSSNLAPLKHLRRAYEANVQRVGGSARRAQCGRSHGRASPGPRFCCPQCGGRRGCPTALHSPATRAADRSQQRGRHQATVRVQRRSGRHREGGGERTAATAVGQAISPSLSTNGTLLHPRRLWMRRRRRCRRY